ncbi:YciI family protein [Massilia sp. YIM B02763]|uniref:YciI family protein n=1 Tax=Massilia sp. YIM B02763 TaxID=3050130 RepID=UPI0025B6C930|nr:YciI family protein [Massilia sp. YIM B02763]MDN4054551.1 YciI family protein [Massilia sp. YIM B02763]
MQFMIIRKADAASEAGAHPSAALIGEMEAYFKQLADAGALVMVQGLERSSRAVRLRLGPGGDLLAKGPFPVAELAAGFLVIEAASKDAAVAWARQWPAADAGPDSELVLEVRETGCVGGCVQVPPPADAGAGRSYFILLRADADTERDFIPEQARLDALDAFNAREAAAGTLLTGDGLMASARGARVRIGAGGSTVVDGPFAEAKELIAGFWMIRAGSLDEAVAWARTVPYPTGPQVVVEIRAAHGSEEAGMDAALSAADARADANLRVGLLDEALRNELAPRLA